MALTLMMYLWVWIKRKRPPQPTLASTAPQVARGPSQSAMKKVEKEIASLEERLANADFVAKAPADVVSKTKARLRELKRNKPG